MPFSANLNPSRPSFFLSISIKFSFEYCLLFVSNHSERQIKWKWIIFSLFELKKTHGLWNYCNKYIQILLFIVVFKENIIFTSLLIFIYFEDKKFFQDILVDYNFPLEFNNYKDNLWNIFGWWKYLI